MINHSLGLLSTQILAMYWILKYRNFSSNSCLMRKLWVCFTPVESNIIESVFVRLRSVYENQIQKILVADVVIAFALTSLNRIFHFLLRKRLKCTWFERIDSVLFWTSKCDCWNMFWSSLPSKMAWTSLQAYMNTAEALAWILNCETQCFQVYLSSVLRMVRFFLEALVGH